MFRCNSLGMAAPSGKDVPDLACPYCAGLTGLGANFLQNTGLEDTVSRLGSTGSLEGLAAWPALGFMTGGLLAVTSMLTAMQEQVCSRCMPVKECHSEAVHACKVQGPWEAM